MKKVFEPATKSCKDVSQDISKVLTENPINNNKALENLTEKIIEIMNYRGLLASYLLFPSSKSTNPEITSQFKLAKDLDSKRVNDLLKTKKIPVTLFDNLLTFPDTDKKFKLEGDLSKMITSKTYNIELAKLLDKKNVEKVLLFRF